MLSWPLHPPGYLKLSFFTLCTFHIFPFPYLLWAIRFWCDSGMCMRRSEHAACRDGLHFPLRAGCPAQQKSWHGRVHGFAFSSVSVFGSFSGFLQPQKYLKPFLVVCLVLLLPFLEFLGPMNPISKGNLSLASTFAPAGDFPSIYSWAKAVIGFSNAYAFSGLREEKYILFMCILSNSTFPDH